MKNNLVLIGMPGSGKSTVGKILAEKMGFSFVDLDAVIENMAKKSISQIFSEDGEPAFSGFGTEKRRRSIHPKQTGDCNRRRRDIAGSEHENAIPKRPYYFPRPAGL